jgi:uncharacterized protein
MQCPNDGQTLAMTTREGIEIDYCPTCRGVWLDRGELDKLIERSAATAAPPAAAASAPAAPYVEPPRGDRGYRRDDDDDDERRRYGPGGYDNRGGYGGHGDYGHGRRKKRSFLGDLFDFD